MTRITHIALDDANMPLPREIDQERVAMFDLLKENSFILPEREKGPVRACHLSLSIRDKRLVFDVQTERLKRQRNFTSPSPLPAGGEGLLPNLRKLFRSGQEAAPQPD